MTGQCCGNRIRRTLEGCKRQITCMRIADGFACNGAQAETLILIERAGLQPSIIEDKRLRFAILHEEFAIIAAFQALRNKAFNIVTVGVEAIDQALHKNNPAACVCHRM